MVLFVNTHGCLLSLGYVSGDAGEFLGTPRLLVASRNFASGRSPQPERIKKESKLVITLVRKLGKNEKWVQFLLSFFDRPFQAKCHASFPNCATLVLVLPY